MTAMGSSIFTQCVEERLCELVFYSLVVIKAEKGGVVNLDEDSYNVRLALFEGSLENKVIDCSFESSIRDIDQSILGDLASELKKVIVSNRRYWKISDFYFYVMMKLIDEISKLDEENVPVKRLLEIFV